MLDKKKIHFWQLAFIFGSITIITLAISYGSFQGNVSQIMSGSMGGMMQMHLEDVTVRDLIVKQEQMESTQLQTSQDHSSHHGETNSFLSAVYFLTTATIVVLLPFILAGTIFLTIIWLK